MNLYTQKNELRKQFAKLLPVSKYNYLTHWQRSQGHCNLISYESDLIALCDLLRLNYKQGNNAPKQGKEGNYIQLSKRAVIKINKLKK